MLEFYQFLSLASLALQVLRDCKTNFKSRLAQDARPVNNPSGFMYPGNTDAVGGRMIVKAEGGGAPEKLVENALRKIFAHLKDSIFMSM